MIKKSNLSQPPKFVENNYKEIVTMKSGFHMFILLHEETKKSHSSHNDNVFITWKRRDIYVIPLLCVLYMFNMY